MRVGGFRLHLFCDNENCPDGYHKNPEEYAESIDPQLKSRRACEIAAKENGWWIGTKDYCPACTATGTYPLHKKRILKLKEDPTSGTCCIQDCTKQSSIRGLCKKHYTKLYNEHLLEEYALPSKRKRTGKNNG